MGGLCSKSQASFSVSAQHELFELSGGMLMSGPMSCEAQNGQSIFPEHISTAAPAIKGPMPIKKISAKQKTSLIFRFIKPSIRLLISLCGIITSCKIFVKRLW